MMGMGGAFQVDGHLLRFSGTAGSLLFVLYFSLRFFCVLKELKLRDAKQASNNTPDGIRQPADGLPKPAV